MSKDGNNYNETPRKTCNNNNNSRAFLPLFFPLFSSQVHGKVTDGHLFEDAKRHAPCIATVY